MNKEKYTQMESLQILLEHDVFYKRFSPVLLKLEEPVVDPIYKMSSDIEKPTFQHLLIRSREMTEDLETITIGMKGEKVTFSNFKFISDKNEVLALLKNEPNNIRGVLKKKYISIGDNDESRRFIQLPLFATINEGLPINLIKEHVFHNYNPDNIEKDELNFKRFYNNVLSPGAAKVFTQPFTKDVKEFILENMQIFIEHFGFNYHTIFEEHYLSEDKDNKKFFGFEINPESIEEHRQAYDSNVFTILKNKNLNLTEKEISHYSLLFMAPTLKKTDESFPMDQNTLTGLGSLLPQDMKKLANMLNKSNDPSENIREYLKILNKDESEENDINVDVIFTMSKKLNPYILHQEKSPALSMQYIDKYNRHQEPLSEQNLSLYTNKSNNRFTEALTIHFKHAQEVICEELGINQLDCIPGNFLIFSGEPLAKARLTFNGKISQDVAKEFLNTVIANINETTLTNAVDTKEMFKLVLRQHIIDSHINQLPVCEDESSSSSASFKI